MAVQRSWSREVSARRPRGGDSTGAGSLLRVVGPPASSTRTRPPAVLAGVQAASSFITTYKSALPPKTNARQLRQRDVTIHHPDAVGIIQLRVIRKHLEQGTPENFLGAVGGQQIDLACPNDREAHVGLYHAAIDEKRLTRQRLR
ncbi:MAG: hypothetical protein B7X65_03815 [Polaromonas sp. 39-63-25]|nr:MAG: hypothetical protein B7Y60_06650 [Polaromonas sp. 35-63-35]OYZ18512.1 MAG: hypothetical protein B7Y28_15835 [Polaromonas sp. 16-63-31]OYZ79618.1 MAG: hypothetical protein B7Y09_08750 [Polaromonas sp. 24-63-21]OZA50765.1 MAG: hypothetical protein B7X88_10970 [Polaromonas sp. 17-63-33]OZA89622.1 MAG: hypothetical protein B7X65_03815 [Polaromonas sp. 39-63-25]